MKRQLSKFDRYISNNFGYGTRTFTTKELILFSEKLLAQIRRKLTIPEALENIFQSTGERTLRMMLMSMTTNVQSGTPLSQSMLTFKDVFPNYYIATIMAAERTGKFVDGLKSLIEMLKNEKQIAEFKGLIGLYARMFSYNVAIALIIFLVQIKVITLSVNSVLITLATVVTVFLFSSIIYRKLTSPNRQVTTSKLIHKIPFVGDLVLHTKISRFCYMFDTFQKAGVPFLQNIELLGSYIDSPLCKNDLQRLYKAIKDNDKPRPILKSMEYFPAQLAQELFLYNTGDTKVDSIRNYSKFENEEINDLSTGLISAFKKLFTWSSLILLGWIYFLIILKL